MHKNVQYEMELEEQLSLLSKKDHLLPSEDLMNRIQDQIQSQQNIIWSKHKAIMMMSLICLMVIINLVFIWNKQSSLHSESVQIPSYFNVNNQLYK